MGWNMEVGAGHDVLRELRVSGSGGECGWRHLSSVGSGSVIRWASVSVSRSRCFFNQVSTFLCRIWKERQV
jgi:hypothetical protein